MTEIPEHLLKRAQAAKDAAAGGDTRTASNGTTEHQIPAHLLERSAARRRGTTEPTPTATFPPIRPAMPEKPTVPQRDIQALAEEAFDDILDMAADAPSELARKLTESLEELVDGSLFELKLAREDGKTTVKVVLDDMVLTQLIVNILGKL